MKQCVERVDVTLDWRPLPELAAWVIEQALAIQRIPAPTFEEQERARYVAAQFRALGLQYVETDSVANVYGLIPGRHPGAPAVMVSAHTDTIFSADTDLTTRRAGDLVYGPGLGDNSIGVAALLGLAVTLQEEGIQPEADIWLVATTREEGLGDLGGMKQAFERLKARVGSVVNLEGLALGHVYHAGIAVRRLHITASAPGGHSWLHYGRASAVHSLVDLAARLVALRPPQTPRTTLNIGMIEGGHGINAIATNASLWLDLRSETRAALENLEADVRAEITRTTAPDLTLAVDLVGDRPAGYLAPDHMLVQAALTALQRQGIRGVLETGSTDGNLPLAQGCPAVTVGVTRGGNAHRNDEFIETPPVEAGLRQIVTLALAVAMHHAGEG